MAAAQASVWVAEAQLTRAKVLWVPTLTLGADYVRHDGGGPDFNKGILTSPSVNFFEAGGGLNVSNAGLFQFVNVTDAYFEPLDRAAGARFPAVGYPGRQRTTPCF